jgi:glutathione S-transferase
MQQYTLYYRIGLADLKEARGYETLSSRVVPLLHRVRAKLTELGIDYEIVNVSASGKRRAELEEVAGTKAIPVLVDGDRIITDSDEAISYLEHSYETDPEELELHGRELSPTVYGVLPFGVKEATKRLREALQEAGIEVLEELDLSSHTGREDRTRCW